MLALVVRAIGDVRDQPAEEGLRTSGLEIDIAGAGEIDHEAFAAEDRRLPAADLADPIRNVGVERHDVPSVDRVLAAGLE